MAGLIVGRLTAQIGLDDSGFTRGVRTAGTSMQALGTQAKGAEQAISTAMKSAVSDVDRYAAKVATARANQAAAAGRAEKAEKALKDAQNAGNAQKAADAEIRLAQARARLTTATQTTQEAVAGLQAANEGAAESSDGATESITNMGETSDSTAGKLAALAIGAVGLGGAMGSILTTGMDFTNSLNEMQAVSGATAAEMDRVSAAARALGSDIDLPGTSAGDAAAAMTELAKGGFSVDQSMTAAKGTLQLAAAAQIDAADAATIQSQALQAFGEDANFAGQAADILANASNASSAEIGDVADSLAQAGTVAAGFGVSMQDTATLLGLFANAGITGSDAGTLLKTSLQSLTDQGEPAQQAIKDLGLTVYDQNGNFAGMRLLWEELTVASQRMTAEQFQASTAILFGSDAMRTAMVSAGGGVEAYDKMAAAIGQQGTAAEVAAAKTQGLPGAWERVKNSLEGVGLTAYDLIQGPLTSLASSGADMIGMGDTLASTLGFIVAPISLLADGFGALPAPMQTILTLMVAMKIATMAFGTQINTARGHLSAAGGVMRNYTRDVTNMQRAAAITGTSMSRLSGHIAVLGRNNSTIANMGAAYYRASGQATQFAGAHGAIAAASVGARGALGGMTSALGGPWGIAIMAGIGLLTLWTSNSQKAKQRTQEQKAAVDELSQSIDVNTGKLNQQGRESVSAKLQSDKIFEAIEANKQWGISIDQFTDAATGQADSIDQVNVALDKQVLASAEASANWRDNGDQYRTAGVSLEEYTSALRGNEAAQDGVRKKLQDQGGNVQGSMLAWKDLTGKLDESGQAAIKTGGALGRATENLDLAKTRTQQMGEANGDLVKSLDGTTQVVGPMTEAMVEFGESTDGAASKVDKLAKALSGLQDDALTEEEALQAWSDNLRDLQKALEEGGAAAVNLDGHIDVTTEKGSALQDSVRGQAEAFNQMAAATYEAALASGQDLPGALDTTREKLQQTRQAFIDQAVAGGMSVEAANKVADAYGMIPSEVVLNLDTASIPKAIANLDALGIKTKTLPMGNVQVIDSTPENIQHLNELQIKYTTLPDGRLVITDTTAENMRRLQELGIATTTLPGGFIRVEDTSPANLQHLKEIGVATVTLPDGSVIINADDAGFKAAIAEAQKAGSKTITVYAVDENGNSVVNNPMFGQGLGVLKNRMGSIQTFADGGHWIDKPTLPGIYRPAADYTIFAEKKTQGETYLPWDPATRGRSLGIMQETANAWGYQVVPARVQAFADGGFNAEAATAVAQAHDDEPYSYGDMDCSGYLSKIHSEGTGQQVRFTTDSDFAALGWAPGDDPGGWTIGTDGGSGPEGHMVGRLFGVPVESGANGVQYGDGAQDPTNFPSVWHWPGASGMQAMAVNTRTEKQKNIDTVIAEGKRRGESDAEIKSAVMAVLAETDGENLDGGMDGDNAGILQQRESWGTKEQRLDPVYAANAYYDAANKVEGAENMTEAQLAQAVQKSGTADGSNYAAKEAEADAEIAASITRSTQTGSLSSDGASGTPVYVTNWPSQMSTTTTSTTTADGSTSTEATEPEVTGKGPLPIVAYANGGMQGRPNGAEVLRGERMWVTQAGEAGIESFIPIDGSSRSVAIWAETGRKLGVLQSFADGGFAGYSEDTSDAFKPKNLYDWAALAAGSGFAVASAVTPYVGMLQSGQLSLGDMLPSFDTSSNSIDGISQAFSEGLEAIVKQLNELIQATRENKQLHSTADPNSGAGLILSAAGL